MGEFADIAETCDWTQGASDDLPFYLSLAQNAKGPILEMGAGTGRLTIPLAELGKKLYALESSETMLARARKKWEAKGNGSHLVFVHGDLGRESFDEPFDLILAPARALEHVLSDQERRDAFAACARHLCPSGVFALHVFGPPQDKNPALPEKSRFIGPTEEHGLLRFSWREELDLATQTRTQYSKVVEVDGQQRTWEHAPVLLRWYTREMLDAFGEQAGLKVEGRYRNFRSEPYEKWSLHMVWVYRKP